MALADPVLWPTESALGRIGYEPRGECGISGRRYFVKEVERRRTHHIHAFEINHLAVIRHLTLRITLPHTPLRRRQYAELKKMLAEQYRDERKRYVEENSLMIAELEKKALDWKEGTQVVNE